MTGRNNKNESKKGACKLKTNNYKIMTRYGMDYVYCSDCLTRLRTIIDPCPKCQKYTKHVYGKMLQNPQDERWTPSAFELYLEAHTVHTYLDEVKN